VTRYAVLTGTPQRPRVELEVPAGPAGEILAARLRDTMGLGRCGRAALRGASTDHGADPPVARGRDRAGCLRLPRDSRLPPAPTGGRRRGWAGRGVPAAGRPPWCRVRPRRPRPFRSRRGVLPRATVGCGGLARPAPAPVTARAGR